VLPCRSSQFSHTSRLWLARVRTRKIKFWFSKHLPTDKRTVYPFSRTMIYRVLLRGTDKTYRINKHVDDGIINIIQLLKTVCGVEFRQRQKSRLLSWLSSPESKRRKLVGVKSYYSPRPYLRFIIISRIRSRKNNIYRYLL